MKFSSYVRQGIKSVFTVLFVGVFGLGFAQNYKSMMDDYSVNFYDVVEAAETYFSTHDNGKGSGWKGFQRWKSENESLYYPSGDRSQEDPNFAQHAYQKFVNTQSHGKRSFENGWIELGPDHANNITSHYSPGIGRVECLWVNRSNTDQIYLGSRSGGFWKTSNQGETWVNTTDFLPASGVNTISASPTNADSILINVRNASNSATHGIYRSIDGGSTWNVTNFNPDNLGWGGLGTNDKIYKIVHHPTVANLIFVGTSKGLYRSTDNLKTWTRFFNGNGITDIEFHPTNTDVIYVFNTKTKGYLRISSDLGLTYANSGDLTGNTSTGYIEVSKKCSDCVYYASTQGIWKSLNQGSDFTFISNPSQNCKGFAVSDVDTTKMIYGYVDLLASVDGGESFTQITKWNNSTPDQTYVHADLRALEYINGVFYAGTDGYLASSADDGVSWKRLNDGTGIREFYAVGVSQSNSYVHIAGSQDNGTSILRKEGWIEWNGGDGMECLVHPLNDNWLIGSWQYGGRNQTKDGGQSRLYLNTTQTLMGSTDWIAPLLIDPKDNMRVYHFSNVIYVSDQFGDVNTWNLLSDPLIGVIKLAAISMENPNNMLICRNADLQLSIDGGKTFASINDGLPNYSITDIAFDPNDGNTIILSYNRHQNDNKKIFISHDLGKTWINITHNLGNMPIRCLAIDHSQESYMYAGAEIGVFYKAMNDTVWQLFNTKFPNVTVRDLEIQFGANIVKAATWGRGLWEYSLAGRLDYPSIVETNLSQRPTELRPADGVPQFVTSEISYSETLSEVYVSWSLGTTTLDSSRVMQNMGDSTWRTVDPIPGFPRGNNVYFSVTAIGNNGDTSVTYRFMYTVRYELVSIETTKTVDAAINIHPNPTKGSVTVTLDDRYKKGMIEITDVTGRQISSTPIEHNQDLSVDLTGPSGIYVITVLTDNGETYAYKILKE